MALGPFQYLSLVSDEIRLLSLDPGSIDDTICCWIEHVSVGSMREYTALSYTWGTGVRSESITINNRYSLSITANLKDALLHLRQETKSRKLWIDAVCINQENVVERNAHLSRMRDIYAQANRVEVWLGKASPADYHALSLLQQIGESIPDPELYLSKGGMVKQATNFGIILDSSSSEVVKALNDLFWRPWWTRVWVVQELSVADQNAAKVTCGNVTLPWLYFLASAYAIEKYWGMLNETLWLKFPDDALDGFNNGIRMAQCRHVQKSQPRHHLLELLHQHRDCKATDPRDYVYGLLGLSGDAPEIGVMPNYSHSVQDIYKDLAVKHICTTKSLDIICACRGERNLANLPSWVPDWSSDQVIPGICINEKYCSGDASTNWPPSQIEKYKASNMSYANVSFSPSADELTTKAFSFGKIAVLSPIDDGLLHENVKTFGRSGPSGKSDSGSETFDQWLNLILDDENYLKLERKYGDHVLDAFSRCLVANRNNKLMKPPAQEDEQYSDQDMDDDDLESIDSSDEEMDDDEMYNGLASEGGSDDDLSQVFSPMRILSMSVREFESCILISWGKRLALLDTGFLGIVPGHCEIGDFAYVLPGCTLPVVLRNKGKTEPWPSLDQRKHSLIGECYFHGVCEGELMEVRGWDNDKSMEEVTLI